MCCNQLPDQLAGRIVVEDEDGWHLIGTTVAVSRKIGPATVISLHEERTRRIASRWPRI